MQKLERSLNIVIVLAVLIVCIKLLSFSTGQLAVIAAAIVLIKAVDKTYDIAKMKVEGTYLNEHQCKCVGCINFDAKK
jgi:hypothetical protein